ncbi:SIR2 family NAD-dependent protein deacylase [Noviherbaspirillum pedocola]|uniref:protein acetyllysine N-acetyltransferase n=1 Tax=Noviherbaspirillum pedocola TaxID=2801341 RepID=A0A934STA3_9BURK|nr:Sir2 family NAD-dependent protein deacetylase [Noviherbaspirillum pedocola]MBK4735232.1 NAD-dependent deacetylase [Noviherbaspirillum pedocola]
MSSPSTENSIARAAALINDADALVIAAGAGFGVDSGLPDFRGTEGFWKAYPALAKSGIAFQDIASPDAFHAHAQQAWGFYGHRLALYRRTRPHAGFSLLRKWGGMKRHGYSVFTSNVDGQFEVAGFDPMRLHECHGSIHHLQCLQPCTEAVWPADGVDPVVDEARCELTSPLPRCPHCGGIARPNILMFGDWSWISKRQDLQETRQQRWLAQVRQPVVIELGAGTAIATVRHFAHRIVRQHNGRLVRINPREPQVADPRDVGLAMGALDALGAIDAALESMQS